MKKFVLISDILNMDSNNQPGILEELGLTDLSNERKKELLEKMSRLIQNRVLLSILRSLSEEDKKEFDKILETNDMEKIHKFLIEKVPDLDKITDAEVEKFTKEVKEQLANLKI